MQGLLIVDHARPVQKKFAVLLALFLRRFRGGHDRQPLLNFGDFDLQRLAGESHVLLGGGDVAGEPEEKIGSRDIGERITEAHVAPVDDAPLAFGRDDDVRRVEVAVAERLPRAKL